MISRLRCERGLGLPEVLVGMVIAIVVLGAAVDAFASFLDRRGHTDRQTQAQDAARTAIDQLAAQLRNAMAPSGKASPIHALASSSDLRFWAPSPSASTTNNPRGLQWVRYCLDYADTTNEKLWMQTAAYDQSQTDPPASGDCPSSSWATSRIVASNLLNRDPGTNKALFTLTTDASTGIARAVAVHAVVDADPTKTPGATDLKSSVNLRNAVLAPVASLTCRAQNGHAICDAGASYDPDGQAISFQWKVVCCSPTYSGGDATWVSGQTSSTYDRGGLTSGSTYRIDVRVTDSYGVYGDASKTLTMP
jgi:type II secretory pathway pseudopilin PulG